MRTGRVTSPWFMVVHRRAGSWFAAAPLLCLFAIIACATSARIPGNTRASPRVQVDVLRMILITEGASDEKCEQHRVVNTEVRRLPTADEYAAVERWTIDRCGKEVRYLVTFRPNPNGGTDVGVRLEQ